MIIGIAGKKQTGKSTAAARLEDHGFNRVSFATPMKLVARTILRQIGLSQAQIDDAEANKEAPLPIVHFSYRKMLQTLGTDWGRKLNPDLWILAAERDIDLCGTTNIVIDDVRFENEADFIRSKGGLIVHIFRESRRYDDHASEAGVEVQPMDAVISNNGSKEGLALRLFAAIERKGEVVV